jgi:hypothetical protein
MKTAMRSPFLRLERAEARDDAGGPDVGLGTGQLGDAPGAERLQVVAEAVERVAAHVEAERLLLAGELLHLGPGAASGSGGGGTRRRPAEPPKSCDCP